MCRVRRRHLRFLTPFSAVGSNPEKGTRKQRSDLLERSCYLPSGLSCSIWHRTRMLLKIVEKCCMLFGTRVNALVICWLQKKRKHTQPDPFQTHRRRHHRRKENWRPRRRESNNGRRTVLNNGRTWRMKPKYTRKVSPRLVDLRASQASPPDLMVLRRKVGSYPNQASHGGDIFLGTPSIRTLYCRKNPHPLCCLDDTQMNQTVLRNADDLPMEPRKREKQCASLWRTIRSISCPRPSENGRSIGRSSSS
mmetsp:Transcript_31033/g.119097  ORF Transcript_31033/g.119097 Transcript_31033/m.119097 type:complete len:250 (-) Transcript_31033:2697-3446(-)